MIYLLATMMNLNASTEILRLDAYSPIFLSFNIQSWNAICSSFQFIYVCNDQVVVTKLKSKLDALKSADDIAPNYQLHLFYKCNYIIITFTNTAFCLPFTLKLTFPDIHRQFKYFYHKHNFSMVGIKAYWIR